MKNFHSPIFISAKQEMIQLAKQFASTVAETVNYHDSNQENKQRISFDHFIGKIGEEAVKSALEHYGNIVEGPDYAVYLQKQKSWDADLIVNGVGLAIKTQKKSSAKRYGLSWTFQYSEQRKDPIVNNPEAWVCFVECNDEDSSYLCTVYPLLQIKDLIFENPRLAHLHGKKKIVYLKTLLKNNVFQQ